jgi:hypothetical protein
MPSHPAKLVFSVLCVSFLCIVALTASLGTDRAEAQGNPPPPPARAPGPGAPAPGGPAAPVMPRYDKATETTLKGPIVELKLLETPNGVPATHLMLQDGPQMIEVFVGPTIYLTAQGMIFAKGESVEVTGSKVQISGAPALLARQIKKGDKSLALRDESGRPAWAKKQP